MHQPSGQETVDGEKHRGERRDEDREGRRVKDEDEDSESLGKGEINKQDLLLILSARHNKRIKIQPHGISFNYTAEAPV